VTPFRGTRFPSPLPAGERPDGIEDDIRVRGLRTNVSAQPPHPPRISRCASTSPRRGEVKRRRYVAPKIVATPTATVTTPTAPCSARLAQVSQRADAASGTAITAESAPMPSIEPRPNSST